MGFLIGFLGGYVGSLVGSLVGTSAEASGGSLLVPGCGSVGLGSGGISSGGASAPSLACAGGSPVLPSDLLVVSAPSSGWSASSSTFGNSCQSSSLPGASKNCSAGPLLPLPVNLAIVMPRGWCDEPPRGVCLVLPICNETKKFL